MRWTIVTSVRLQHSVLLVHCSPSCLCRHIVEAFPGQVMTKVEAGNKVLPPGAPINTPFSQFHEGILRTFEMRIEDKGAHDEEFDKEGLHHAMKGQPLKHIQQLIIPSRCHATQVSQIKAYSKISDSLYSKLTSHVTYWLQLDLAKNSLAWRLFTVELWLLILSHTEHHGNLFCPLQDTLSNDTITN